MTELTVRSEMGANIEWAKTMAASNLLPASFKGNAPNLLYAVELADALQIPRINAVTNIHVISGKPTMSSDLMAALVRQAGHKLRVQIAADGKSARATLIRKDDPDFVYESVWSWDRAVASKLTGKDTWKNFPQAMLRNRAISEVIRQGASEVLVGVIYTPEELGAVVDGQGAPVTVDAPRSAFAEAATPEPVDVSAAVEVDAVFEDVPLFEAGADGS